MRAPVLASPWQSYLWRRVTKSGAHRAIWNASQKCRSGIRFVLIWPIRFPSRTAFNSALTDAGYFDVLINNAGAGHFDPAELVPMETITSQFQILVFGQIQLMQLALRHMQSRGEGLIINVTSLASRLPVPFMAAYNAAKAAMASFTMSIQLELGNSRVRVVDLQPADIRTEFNQGVVKSTQVNPRYDTKIAKTWEIAERNMKNAPTPDLVARHVLRLDQRGLSRRRDITVGDAFQSKIAPLIFRFLPQRLRIVGIEEVLPDMTAYL